MKRLSGKQLPQEATIPSCRNTPYRMTYLAPGLIPFITYLCNVVLQTSILIMVEVFKTNVEDKNDAWRIIMQISRIFEGYQVNFDLEDCDRILRIKSCDVIVDSKAIISLLEHAGFSAELLDDMEPLFSGN
jgi:hypothetical protein